MHRISLWRRFVPAVLLLAAALATAFLFTGVLSEKADDEALEMARQAIREAAVECYALEGCYPADLEHLYDTYGVSVDRERYIVHYQYIASNLLPDITVLPAE